MSGREDYEERKQERIDRLNDAAYKLSKESTAAMQRSHDLVKDIPLGQPNIRGALTGTLNKARSAADRALAASEKSSYYADRAAAAENNNTISSDDPDAIEKLQAKIEALELKRDNIKAFNKDAKKNGTSPAAWYELPYISKEIKRLKDRIANLERIDRMPAELIEFDGGEIESDPITNRVIIRYDERQPGEITEKLSSNGFHWSPTVRGWTRLRNRNALYAAKQICKADNTTPDLTEAHDDRL